MFNESPCALPFCDTNKACTNVLGNAHPTREWVVYGFLACAHQLFCSTTHVIHRWPVNSPQMASNAENVSIWWQHVFLGPCLSFPRSPSFMAIHQPPSCQWRSYSFPISLSKELPWVMHQAGSLMVHGSISYTVYELINSNLVKHPWLLHQKWHNKQVIILLIMSEIVTRLDH